MKKEDDDWQFPAITGNYVKKMGAEGLKFPQSLFSSNLMHPLLFSPEAPLHIFVGLCYDRPPNYDF